LASAFETADYLYVLPAAGLSLLGICFRAVRWKYLLNPTKKIGLLNLFSATSIGFMANGVLPARLGELIRAYVIGQKENISKSSAFATVVVARIFDGMTVLLLLVIILLRYSYNFPDWLQRIAYAAFILFFFALACIIFLRLRTETASRFTVFILKPFPERLSSQITKWLHSFINGLEIIKSFKNLIMAAIYSLLVWLPNAFVIYVLARSFGMDLPVSGAFLVMTIVSLGMMIPSAPAFLGTIQYCSVIGLSFFGIAKADALSFSVIYHLCSFLPITIVGFAFLFKEGYSLMELRKFAGEKTDR